MFGSGYAEAVLEQDGGERLSHVPFEVVGEHAQEDVGTDPVGAAVVDGADLEVERLHAAEGGLHRGEGLVGADGLFGGEQFGLGIGAEDVEAVEGPFPGDGVFVPAEDEGGVGDFGEEVLFDLEAADEGSDPLPDAGGAAQRSALAPGGGGDGFQPPFGAGEQVFALAAALLGEPGVEADHQALPGVAVGGDLGQVPPVEEGGVHRAGFDQGAEVGGAERGDPAEALLRAQVLADAPGGEHPPVADQDQLAEAEAVAEFGHLGGHRPGVGGVAGEDLDGDRAALPGAEQAEDDLQGVALAVAAVAAPGQRAASALEVGGGEVVEDEGVVAEVLGGQPGLDGRLAGAEPVEGGVELVLLDLAEIEEGAEGGGGGLRGEGPGGGEFGAGGEEAGGDEGQGEVAGAGALLASERPMDWVQTTG